MPRQKIPCPSCGQPMSATATMCRQCKPTYRRTKAHRQRMSDAMKGKPKPWLRGQSRPDHAEAMREWWTEERREAKRREMLKRNPLARYHGLSMKGAAKIRKAAGKCETCGSTRNLDVHHRDGNKRNQVMSNLSVLCHRCHMRLHSAQGDLKRKTSRD